MVEVLEQRRLLSTIYSASMNLNPGWTLDAVAGAVWSYGTPAGLAGDPASGHTGTKVIGTVIASPGSYSANVSGASYAKTPAINCSGYHGVTLDFWRWLRADVYDNADIQVSANGSAWSSIWPEHLGVMETSWSHQTFDISSIADNHSIVYIRWGLGPTNATGNYGGWNIDDVTVSGSNDNTPPTVSARTPDTGSLVVSPAPNVDVTFSEAVQGVDATDLVLSGPAAVSASIGTPANVSGNTWRFPVSGLLSGALTMTLAPDAGDITDLGGNGLAASSWDASVNVSSMIAYEYRTDDPFSLAQINTVLPNGGSLATLTSGLGDETRPAFNFDGTRIAYNEGSKLDAMNADGSSQTVLAGSSFSSYIGPTYSPDGTKIAVSCTNQASNPFLASILLLNADGTGGSWVTNDLPNSAVSNVHPSFSPDGTRIAFASSRDGNMEIYLINVNGTDPVRLTNVAADDFDPTFSRDGSRITFTSERDGNREVYVMNADGTNPVRLTNNAASDSQPCFSPDGTQIAFTSDRDGGGGEIYIMNANGSNPVRLTGLTGRSTSPAWGVDARAPQVSSITPTGSSPTNASSLQWTVTFSESVTGVDPTDFALIKTGSANGTIASVAGSGTSYTVTVNSVTGDGTLRLNLVDDDSVHDLGANQLGTSGAGNGDFADATGYTVDHTPPAVGVLVTTGVSSFTNAATVKFYLSFNTAVTGLDPTDFVVVHGGTANGTVTSLTSLSSGTYYVNVSVSGEGPLGINLVDNDTIVDAAGNPLGGVGLGNGSVTGGSFTLDQTAPSVLSVARLGVTPTNATSLQWAVTFSEAVQGVDLSYFSLAKTGSANGSVASVTGSGTTYTVTVSAVSGEGSMGLNLADTDQIRDLAGNSLGGPGFGTIQGEAYQLEQIDTNDAPTDIALSSSSVAENQPIGTAVGTLTTTDPDVGDTFTYTLVSGTGSTDNASFSIAGGILQTAASFNYEAQNSYSVRVRTTDQGGLFFEKAFAINVTNVRESTIAGRKLFYNHSTFDGGNAAANASDDNAIATDKTALLPGNTATFANYSSYSRGLNGIMLDLGSFSGILSASDFTFKVGNNSTPSGWAAALTPTSITQRSIAGGITRVTLIWADNAIQKKWLQVTLLASVNSDLAANDVFYFGNAIAETGNSAANAIVNSTDEALVKNHQSGLSTVGITSVYDLNRDTRVNSSDLALARNNKSGLTPILLISPPAGGGAAMVQSRQAAMPATSQVLADVVPVLASSPVASWSQSLLFPDDVLVEDLLA